MIDNEIDNLQLWIYLLLLTEFENLMKNNNLIGEKKMEEKYGKFKDADALLQAYKSLEKEFTRRSQRLRELETENERLLEEHKTMEHNLGFYRDKYLEYGNKIAKEIYNELCGHGTTYVKKWIKERYNLEVE